MKKLMKIVAVMALAHVVSAGEIKDDGGCAFGFKLLSQMFREQKEGEIENLLVSPYSLRTTFAMLQSGAKDATAEELEQVLGQPSDAVKSVADYSEITKKEKGSTVLSANSVWYDEKWPVNKEYMALMNQFCKGQVIPHDFHATGWPKKINKFVDDNTRGMIKSVFDPQSEPAPEDVDWMVLVNTLYFNGKWLNAFEKENTVIRKFDCYGKKQDAYMLAGNSGWYMCDEAQGIAAAELAFCREKKVMDSYSFIAILPKDNTKESMLATLDYLQNGGFLKLREECHRDCRLELKMPRLDIDFESGLKKTLSDLGMKTAMGDSPDYSGLWAPDGNHLPPKIKDVIHKTILKLDEEGAKAAAATAIRVESRAMCAPPKKVRFYADRPFVAVIYDRVRKNVLFAGVIMNPGTPGEKPGKIDAE